MTSPQTRRVCKLCGLVIALALSACTHPQDSGIKVIVGARLEPGPGRDPIEYSVVVISGDKIQAAGSQSATPVPKGSEITRGLGMTLRSAAAGESVEAGRAANLILEGAGQRREMRNGEWVN